MWRASTYLAIFSMWEFPVTSKHTNKLATLQHLSSSSYMLLYVHKSTLVAIWRRVRVRRNPFGLLSATLYIARVQSVEGILNFKHWHAHGAWKRHSKTSFATSLHSKKNHTSPTPSPAHHHHPNALRTNSRVRLIATQRHQWIVMCVCFFVCVCRRDIYHFDILQQCAAYAEQCLQYGLPVNFIHFVIRWDESETWKGRVPSSYSRRKTDVGVYWSYV